jgi:hypothetical protein
MMRSVDRLYPFLLVSLFALLLLPFPAMTSQESSPRIFSAASSHSSLPHHLCGICPSPFAPRNDISAFANFVEEKDDKATPDEAVSFYPQPEHTPAWHATLKRTSAKRSQPPVTRFPAFRTPAVFLITERIRI